MFLVSWPELKSFFDANKPLATLNYFEKSNSYHVWAEYKEQVFNCPEMYKTTATCQEFEESYKAQCNVKEPTKFRIITCKVGRKMHSRFITIKTAAGQDEDKYDNTDWQDNDYGDLTYIMLDANKQITTNDAEAKETWIDWEPAFDYEISGGAVFVSSNLAGEDDDAWEIHVVGAPDIPAQYGGNVHFISNPRMKWVKGTWLVIDASLNPSELPYNATQHSNKIRFVFKHPVGAKTEFQIQLTVFK